MMPANLWRSVGLSIDRRSIHSRPIVGGEPIEGWRALLLKVADYHLNHAIEFRVFRALGTLGIT